MSTSRYLLLKLFAGGQDRSNMCVDRTLHLSTCKSVAKTPPRSPIDAVQASVMWTAATWLQRTLQSTGRTWGLSIRPHRLEVSRVDPALFLSETQPLARRPSWPSISLPSLPHKSWPSLFVSSDSSGLWDLWVQLPSLFDTCWLMDANDLMWL